MNDMQACFCRFGIDKGKDYRVKRLKILFRFKEKVKTISLERFELNDELTPMHF